jgi:hypothetical protein
MRLSLALAAAVSCALLLVPFPASAHRRDLMTVNGRVGNIIQTGETTNADMKEMFGRPSEKKIVRVGCSRVIRLRWRGDIQTYAYKGDPDRVVVDVKVNAAEVTARRLGETYAFHTRKGLRVSDSEETLQELYPRRNGITHNGHTHYILRDSGTKLLGKVIDGVVVQLEVAPYEFC